MPVVQIVAEVSDGVRVTNGVRIAVIVLAVLYKPDEFPQALF